MCADEEFFDCSGCLKSQLCSFIHQPRRERKGHGIVVLEFIGALLCDCSICALELRDLLLYILIVSFCLLCGSLSVCVDEEVYGCSTSTMTFLFKLVC